MQPGEDLEANRLLADASDKGLDDLEVDVRLEQRETNLTQGGIEGYQLSVVDWIPLEIPASEHTRRYLKTKKDKLGHKLSSV
jgi:GTP cyclohydrolase II